MGAPDSPEPAGMSIGAVLDLLRPEFPEVSHSKIRFLETEGLVTPQRAASGYRRYSAYDYARLRYVLTAQRDHYLPLKVIKARLDAEESGALPSSDSPYPTPRLVPVIGIAGQDATSAPVVPRQIRLSREDLLERSGADDTLLTALVRSGVISAGPGGLFDEHSVVIVQCARGLADYGVEPRHLRAFRSAADRQSDLIAQIAGPLVKGGKAGGRDRADDLAREVAALAIALHTALLKSSVHDVLHG
ncbi:MerR family transcriptional regulator [[Mycobacterium] kokjensenii]|uniref:MerR family transcriptional regulator n=1 Tax=[Mycobacterium] kokjensenii TaxID=3064287 RepID=A0ABN9MZS8_9MYCO|nr:MerR family transcriptional regulator [Mycolicibacter sp. MU0083]CAJ1498000.1 MerR family transcriptional regulator [Mycolicibacter sp. MU0083]